MLCRVEEISQKREDRLQQLEDSHQERTAHAEAVVSRSNGNQVPSAAQNEEQPADPSLLGICQATTPPMDKPPKTIHKTGMAATTRGKGEMCTTARAGSLIRAVMWSATASTG